MASLEQIEDFLQPVALEATKLLNISPPEGEDAESFIDPKILICSRVAFSQVENFLKRSVIKNTYKERHGNICEDLYFKNFPVTKVTSVNIRAKMFSEPSLLVVTEDYAFDRNKLFFTLPLHVGIVDVVLQGGFDSADEDSGLFYGLLQQTMANYNRKETTGLRTVNGGGESGGSVTVSDAGGLVNAAKISLEPLVYYGNAEDL